MSSCRPRQSFETAEGRRKAWEAGRREDGENKIGRGDSRQTAKLLRQMQIVSLRPFDGLALRISD